MKAKFQHPFIARTTSLRSVWKELLVLSPKKLGARRARFKIGPVAWGGREGF
jgi:hypothetical protein